MKNKSLKKDSIKWYTSKGVWTGIVTAILGAVIPLIDIVFHTHLTQTNYYNIAIFIAGCFGIHFRIGTNRPVEKSLL